MIILDTNVLSEPLRQQPNDAVLDWFDRQSIDTIYLTTTSLAELFLGIELLPKGKRKTGLSAELAEWIKRRIGERILSLDRHAAMAYAALVGKARANGFQISIPDGQIAAIASVHKFIVATRDTTPFEAAGVPVVNPWAE